MANTASKTSKTSKPVTAADRAAGMAQFSQTIVAALQKGEAEAKAVSTACVEAIATLWLLFTGDGAAWQTAIVELLGNGKTGNARVAGTLLRKLEDAKLSPGTIRSYMSRLRDVAQYWAVEAVQTAANTNGLKAAQNVAKPRAKPAPRTPAAETPSAATTYSAETLEGLIHEHLGDTLAGVESYFAAAGDREAMKLIAELKIHLASKTRKTGTG